MNYDDDIRKDLHVEARGLRETAQKHGDACSGWLRFRRENDIRMEAGQLQLHRNEGHLQGFELCCEIAHECRAENPSAEFCSSNGECHGQLGRKASPS